VKTSLLLGLPDISYLTFSYPGVSYHGRF